MLNGTEVSVKKFPLIALSLYRLADQEAPNRVINTVGMARANAHLHRHMTAAGLYQQLLFQMTSSHSHDEYFLQEANEYLDRYNSAIQFSFSLMLIIFSLSICFYSSLKFQ